MGTQVSHKLMHGVYYLLLEGEIHVTLIHVVCVNSKSVYAQMAWEITSNVSVQAFFRHISYFPTIISASFYTSTYLQIGIIFQFPFAYEMHETMTKTLKH